MARLAPEDWLARARAQARARGGDALADLVLPDRRVEAWKYSRVGALLEEGLLDAVDGSAAVPDVPAIGESFDRLLFVDGRLRVVPHLPDGVTLVRSEVPSTTEDARPFAALNAALADEAWRLEVAPGVRLEAGLEIVFAQNADGRACGAHPRLQIEIGQGAEAHLVERQVGAACSFTNCVIEVQVGANARLSHERLGLDGGAGRWLTALDVRVDRDARYGLHQALVGAAFRRNEITVNLDAPGAHAEVGGASLTRDRAHLDTQMCLEHAAPHCTSNQVFRAIAGEKSRTILNGRIHIHRDAQKTAAELSTKNLLLSPEAEIDAKPELEIYADDVTCAHGATIGQLDERALFYLRSRGVDAKFARTLLSFAFLADVVGGFPQAAVSEVARAALEQAFSAPSALES